MFRNGDYYITYSKKKADFIIEVSGELSLKSNYIPNSNHLDIDELLKNSVYMISIVIQHKYKKANILYFDLFDKANREKLKIDINNTEVKNIEQILKIYSDFLMNELKKLNIIRD